MNSRTALFAYEDAAQDCESINWAIDEARNYADHDEVDRLIKCYRAAAQKRDALRAEFIRTLES